MIYGPTNNNVTWRTRDNKEMYMLCDELDMAKVKKYKRMRRLGHLFSTQETYPCKKLTHHKPEGIRHVGKPRLRWLESVVEDQKNMDVRNWRRKSQD